jgi:hypothetical protein
LPATLPIKGESEFVLCHGNCRWTMWSCEDVLLQIFYIFSPPILKAILFSTSKLNTC